MSAQLFVHTGRIELGKLLTGGFRFQTPTSPRDHRVRSQEPMRNVVRDGSNRIEWPKWYHFPCLYVPCRPVVHQNQAEDILLRLFD